ncbi:MAG: hypothetical protein DI536_14040 [Archangium gephyra]|uniref:Uncharacterized protein n=1 Tax=Archangium gephyra TaxID=48 RepID=A0A2W5THF9_9BACT|nr:MAG: hypothetical protein DI536_14040 [Archangium gephyra]
MLRALGLTLLLISLRAFAQEADFVLPEFEARDAGFPEPTPPPTPAPDAVAPAVPRVPPTPRWAPIGGSLSAMFTAFQEYFLSAELSLLFTTVGVPKASETVPHEFEGWLMQLGGTAFVGTAGNAVCDGTVFCATRGGGGAALKFGWARGLPNVSTGATRPQTMYFGQLDVMFSYFGIESAPLSPGLQTAELLTRLRLGVHLTTGSRVTSTGFTFLLAGVFQAVPVSNGTQGVSFGANFGVGF